MGFYTSVRKRSNKILYRGYNDNGIATQHAYKFQPTIFMPVKEKTEWMALDGTPVEPRKFDSIYECDTFVKENSVLKMYGNTRWADQFIGDKFPGKIDFDIGLMNIVNFDIEVASGDGFPHPNQAASEIISITLKSSRSKIYTVFGLGNYDASKTKLDIPPEDIRYRKCKSEIHLLAQFMKYWTSDYPDIITGWNIKFFDVPYIVNRIVRLVGEDVAKQLSPWGHVDSTSVFQGHSSRDTYDIIGIEVADYMELFTKFGVSYGPQESYSLDHISRVVLKERKLSYEEHGSLHTLYLKDHQKFIDYNIKDVNLVHRMDLETNLIYLALTMAYRGGVNLSATFGTTAIWDSIIYRSLNTVKIAIPFNTQNNKASYPGGYVKEPIPGMYRWVVGFDLNSLYPNLIVQYNMSPETLTNEVRPHGVDHYFNLKEKVTSQNTVASNGSTYTKDYQGILPRIIENYYAERKEIQGRQNEAEKRYEKTKDDADKKEGTALYNQQMAIKLLLNSLYGAMGNQYFRYFDLRIAEGITLSGQLSIKWAERVVNTEMNRVLKTEGVDYIIAIDTDSLYVNFDPLIQQLGGVDKLKDPVTAIDRICKEHFVPHITKGYDKLFEMTNGYKPRMWMGREVIADVGIWTAKKRYILNVQDKEGVRYAEPKLKIMGIEAIKSSTPEVCRDKLKEIFKIIMRGSEEEVRAYIKDFKEEFFELPAEEISFPRGVSNVDKYVDHRTGKYVNRTPIHSRGSVIYNKIIRDLDLEKEYPLISNGDKIKFCYLKQPNPTRENVIAFPMYLPREIGVDKYLDYGKQFQKTFMAPLDPIFDAIGWSKDNTTNLNSLFG